MPSSRDPAGPSRGENTRRRIIRQSAPVFNTQGYAGTSMSDLMTATGLEKGGLYRHFDCKESLAAAAFDYAWETVCEARLRGLEDCGTGLEKLVLLVRNFTGQAPTPLPGGCPLLNAAIDSDDGNPSIRDRARAALAGWQSFLTELVCGAQREGGLRGDVDARSVATVMIAALEGAIMMSRLEKSREPLHRVGDHLEGYLRSLQATQ